MITQFRRVVCRVPSRVCVHMHGNDMIPFLQGLTTNNVEKFFASPSPISMFTGLLSPQGKVLFETILHKPRCTQANEVMMECDVSNVDQLFLHFKKYKLRSKVQWELSNDYQVWSIHNSTVATRLSSPAALPRDIDDKSIMTGFEKPWSWSIDPRQAIMGIRVISPTFTPPVTNNLSSQAATDQQQNEGWKDDNGFCYTLHRYINGIAEGSHDFPSHSSQQLPQESNLDFYNGIDYRKGCYVGQELTIRTHHRGVVRKRIIPIKITPKPLANSEISYDGKPQFYNGPLPNAQSLANCKLSVVNNGNGNGKGEGEEGVEKRQRGRLDGRVISNLEGYGLAVIRLEKFDGTVGKVEFEVESDEWGSKVQVEAHWPKWWPIKYNYST